MDKDYQKSYKLNAERYVFTTNKEGLIIECNDGTFEIYVCGQNPKVYLDKSEVKAMYLEGKIKRAISTFMTFRKDIAIRLAPCIPPPGDNEIDRDRWAERLIRMADAILAHTDCQ